MRYKIINRKKLFATIAADVVGNIVFSPVKMFRKGGDLNKNIRNILIIRTAYVGDILMTLPVLKPLKARFPQAKISFLASREGAQLLKGNPYIDRIFHLNPFWFYQSSIMEYLHFIKQVRAERFDIVLEARGDIRELWFIVSLLRSRFKVSYGFGGGAYLLTHVVPFTHIKHRVEYHLDLVRYLGCSTDGIEWGIYLSEDERKGIREILEDSGIKEPFVTVHPGARGPLKRWSTKGYAEVCDSIREQYKMPLVLLGSEAEKNLTSEIAKNTRLNPIILTGRLSLRELAGILSESALFICNDSAPMHIAAAMKTPTVAIFGPSKSLETGPYGNICRIVEKDFPCRVTCDESVCSHNMYQACMKAISPQDVFSAVRELMDS